MPNNWPGANVGRAQAAADIRGARRQHAGFDAVGAARAELDHGPPGGGFGHARRLRCDHRLETDRGQQRGLHDLRFGDRRGDAQKRLARKTDGAFRHRPDVAGKAKGRQDNRKNCAPMPAKAGCRRR